MTGSDVLLHAFDLPPLDGGIPRLCSGLAQSFAARGARVRVLTSRRGGVAPSTPGISTSTVSPWRIVRELAALSALKRHSPAVTISGIWYPEGLLAVIAGRRPRIILAHGREILAPPSWLRRRIWPLLLRHVLSSADLVLANGAFTAGLVKRAAPQATVEYVPLGVDTRRFCPGDRERSRRTWGAANGARVLLTVARLKDHKAHESVLRALSSLPPDVRRRITWWVAGRGPEARRLELEARALGVSERVRFLGFVPEARLVELYRAADAFVLCPPHSLATRAVEGFGIALLEAQACGVPVIATRSGGIVEAVCDGQGGFLLEPGNLQALRAVLERFVLEPEIFRAQGERGRQRMLQHHDWERFMDGVEAALRRHGIGIGVSAQPSLGDL
jgi:glycosyltransferase involved in cell wall biosynthesis